jgi:predicted nucleotidyltransferase component of viral defense system
MPRLSVDIDLTYIPIESWDETLKNIELALGRIQRELEKTFTVTVLHQIPACKLLVSSKSAQIKVEVNPVSRGVIGPVEKKVLCKRAQEQFDVFSAIAVVPTGQLYGGKICAALSRQHPRDLFDVKYLLSNEGFSSAIKTGFIYCLLSSSSPIHDVIRPNLHDQRRTMDTQFTGMSRDLFSYEDFEVTRLQLLKTIAENLTTQDKQFILSVKGLKPDWGIYDFSGFPAIRWKIQNLEKLKETDLKKYQAQYDELRFKLNM